MNIPGGWDIVDMPAGPIPEKVAAAFADATSSLMGAQYIPLLYCGEQVVRGINYMLICEQKIMASGAPKHIVQMTINVSESGSSSIVSISQLV